MSNEKKIYSYTQLAYKSGLSVTEKNYFIGMLRGDFQHTITKEQLDKIIEVSLNDHVDFITKLIKIKDKCR